MRSSLRSVLSCRKWRRASTTNNWRNCSLSLTATQFLDGRAISRTGDRTFANDQAFAKSATQKTSDLTFAGMEKEKVGDRILSDNLTLTYEALKSSEKGTEATPSASVDSAGEKLLIDEVTKEMNMQLDDLTVINSVDRSIGGKTLENSSSIAHSTAASQSSTALEAETESSTEYKSERHPYRDFYESNPYYADDLVGGIQKNKNNVSSIDSEVVDNDNSNIIKSESDSSSLQVSPQTKNDLLLTKIGNHWVSIKGKIADSWQKLDDVEDELRKKALASLPKYRKKSLSAATESTASKKSENKLQKSFSIISPVDLLTRVDSATKQMNKVVTSMTSALSSASSSSSSSSPTSTTPTKTSAAAAKFENVFNIPLHKLVKMQVSTVEAINNLQDQVNSAEIVINIKKRLMKEEEENQEMTRERQALEGRKVFLRNRCYKKLFVGEYSVYKFRKTEISDHQPPFGEVEEEDSDLNSMFSSWGSRLKGVEEEEENGRMGSIPTSAFQGNWTGLQLKEEEADDSLVYSLSNPNKSKFEVRLRRIFFAMRNAENETELARFTLLLTKILRINPKLRTLVYEEKMLPFLLRNLESSPPGSPKHSIFRETLSIVGHALPLPSRGVRILAIDGGGIRAVVSVLLLKKLQEECGGTPIQELFDYVVGVSTGSILAAMAAIYDCPLDDCEKMYRIMSKEIFDRTPLTGAPTLVMRHAYYDTEFWNELLRRDFGQLEMSETARHASIPKVAIISTAANLSRMTPYLLRNYHLPLSAPSKLPGTTNVKVWEALRASSAAAGLFQECRLGNVVHWDGGLIANNPTSLAVHEAKLIWPREPIQCVVSLGTGRYIADEDILAKQKEMTPLVVKIGKLIDGATDTECVHTTMQDFLPKASYFRFNPYMSEDILLDETRQEKVDQLMKDGELYLRKNEAKIKAAAERLVEPRRRWQQWEDRARTIADKML